MSGNAMRNLSLMHATYLLCRTQIGLHRWSCTAIQNLSKIISPNQNRIAIVNILQGCINLKAIGEGKKVHARIIATALDDDIFVGNRLIEMYAKCSVDFVDAHRVFDRMAQRNVFSWNLIIDGYVHFGDLDDAHDLFDKMPQRDEVSWNTMIMGFARYGQPEKALALFSQMHSSGIKPTLFTFVALLNICGRLSDLGQGEQLHAQAIRYGLQSSIIVANALLDMYAKCGRMKQAGQVFDEMPERDAISWTAMVTGFSKSGQTEMALAYFVQMRRAGLRPDHFTFSSVLSACGRLGNLDTTIRENGVDAGYAPSMCGRESLEMSTENTRGVLNCASDGLSALEIGKQVHAQVIKTGSELSVFVGNALVDMYAKCKSITHAEQVFEKLSQYSAVSWNAMIAGYGQNGLAERSLELLREMEGQGMWPDLITYATVFSACVKCGIIENARKLFDKMSDRSLISWNTMIAGYAHNGHGEEAQKLFRQMQMEDLNPDEVTMTSILPACSSPEGLEYGRQVHGLINKTGLQSSVFVGSALLDMYGKCGNLENARKVFDNMPYLDGVAWNSIISGYAEHAHSEEVMSIFHQMLWAGIKPDPFTFGSIVGACARLAALGHGKQVHSQIVRWGFESNVFVGTALVDLYCKSGSIEAARRVFDIMSERSVVSWNGMITGYAHNGRGMEAIQLFEHMLRVEEKPDNITFIGVLSACSHAGLVVEGLKYFDSMSREHSITPQTDHYACIIDLLGRAGRLAEAQDFINNMPFEPDAVVWGTLLSACRTNVNMEAGEHSAKCLLKLQPENPSPYVLLSNIYAGSGRWDDAANLRMMMKDVQVKKEPGCSWIEIKTKGHAFLADDR